MKKCNNCGYPCLEDYATKCRCGAVVDTTLFTCLVTIFLLSNIECVLALVGLYSFDNKIDLANSYLNLFFILYPIQSIPFYIYNKNKLKKSGAKITNFTPAEPKITFKKNENYSSRIVDKQEEPKGTCTNSNGSNFVAGVVTGVILNEVFDND